MLIKIHAATPAYYGCPGASCTVLPVGDDSEGLIMQLSARVEEEEVFLF